MDIPSPKKDRSAPADDGDGEDDAGGGIAQIAHTVAHEDLVDNVVKTRDDEGQRAGDGELQQELSHPLCSQIIVFLHK